MENPSASRLASPNIRMIPEDKEAPTTPATIANVVTEPSIPPYTNSGKYFLIIFVMGNIVTEGLLVIECVFVLRFWNENLLRDRYFLPRH